MAASLSIIVAKDGAGATVVGGVQALDLSGAGTGPWSIANILVDGLAGVNRAAVLAVSTAPVTATHPALVVGIRPDGNAVTASIAAAQTLATVTNLATIAGQAPAYGSGVNGATVLRVGLATDSPGIIATGTAGAASATVLTIQGIASMTPIGVSIASGGVASGSIASGAVASGAFASGSIAAGAIATGATSIAANEDDASASADTGVKILVIQKATPADTAGADGDYANPQMSAGRIWASANTVDRFFDAAATTLTRPANTTAYSVNDSVSNNGTAGSVTALSATVSDTNNAPILISEVILDTNDTGIGAATVTIRCYLYNSDPTANSGVVAGDNAAFSNKRAGLIGTLTGTFVAMSDGGKARCVPDSGSYIVAAPTSGAQTIFIQHQIVAGTPTPSANSTTIISNIRGIQGRA